MRSSPIQYYCKVKNPVKQSIVYCIVFLLGFILLLAPLTVYGTYQARHELNEKVEKTEYTEKQIDTLHAELNEAGFTDEDISNMRALEVNSSGLTYGIDALGADLIAVISDQGEHGYIYRRDLDRPSPRTIEEALAISGKGRVITVFKEDGVTEIGTFTISSQ